MDYLITIRTQWETPYESNFRQEIDTAGPCVCTPACMLCALWRLQAYVCVYLHVLYKLSVCLSQELGSKNVEKMSRDYGLEDFKTHS